MSGKSFEQVFNEVFGASDAKSAMEEVLQGAPQSFATDSKNPNDLGSTLLLELISICVIFSEMFFFVFRVLRNGDREGQGGQTERLRNRQAARGHQGHLYHCHAKERYHGYPPLLEPSSIY